MRYLSRESERSLVLQAQDGDKDALQKLLDSMTPFLVLHARRIANEHPPADPDDLVQTAYTRIIRYLNKFDLARNIRFITYFGRAAFREMQATAMDNGIVRALAMRQIVSRKPETKNRMRRHAGRLQSLDVTDETLIDETSTDRIRQWEQITDVRECVAKLPDRCRRLVYLKFFDGLTLTQIAATEGCTKHSVRRELAGAIGKLKTSLVN